jgi:hypothetical protein
MPSWWHWNNPYANEQEISNGVSKTDDKGEFEVKFIAKINANINPKLKPTFQYRIMVDVIDQGGETRSGNVTTNLGFVALAGTINVADWILAGENFQVNMSTQSLDGKPQEVSGEIAFYQLKSPSQVTRKASSENQYWYWYRYYFLNDTNSKNLSDQSNFENWELEKLIKKQAFKTNTDFKNG